MLEAMETLQEENAELWRRVAKLENTTDHMYNEHGVGETQYDPEVDGEQVEKRKMSNELKESARKYAEMEKRMRGSFSMQNFLN